jgi:hypothetical protein
MAKHIAMHTEESVFLIYSARYDFFIDQSTRQSANWNARATMQASWRGGVCLTGNRVPLSEHVSNKPGET